MTFILKRTYHYLLALDLMDSNTLSLITMKILLTNYFITLKSAKSKIKKYHYVV